MYSEYMQGVQVRVHMTEQKSCYERIVCQNSTLCNFFQGQNIFSKQNQALS